MFKDVESAHRLLHAAPVKFMLEPAPTMEGEGPGIPRMVFVNGKWYEDKREGGELTRSEREMEVRSEEAFQEMGKDDYLGLGGEKEEQEQEQGQGQEQEQEQELGKDQEQESIIDHFSNPSDILHSPPSYMTSPAANAQTPKPPSTSISHPLLNPNPPKAKHFRLTADYSEQNHASAIAATPYAGKFISRSRDMVQEDLTRTVPLRGLNDVTFYNPRLPRQRRKDEREVEELRGLGTLWKEGMGEEGEGKDGERWSGSSLGEKEESESKFGVEAPKGSWARMML